MPSKKEEYYTLDMNISVLGLPEEVSRWFYYRYQACPLDGLLTFNMKCMETIGGFTAEQRVEVERIIQDFWKGAEKGEYKIYPTERDAEKRFRRPFGHGSYGYFTDRHAKYLLEVLTTKEQRLISGEYMEKDGRKTFPVDYKGLLETPGYGVVSARNTLLFYSALATLREERIQWTGPLNANISVERMGLSDRALAFLEVNNIYDLYALDMEQESLEDLGAGPWIAGEIRACLKQMLCETEGIPQTEKALASAYYQRFGNALSLSQWENIVEKAAKNSKTSILNREFIQSLHRDNDFVKGVMKDLKERLTRTREVLDEEAAQRLFPEFLKTETMWSAFDSLNFTLFYSRIWDDIHLISLAGGHLAPKDISIAEYYCAVYPDDADTFIKCVNAKNSTQELQQLGVTKHKVEVVKNRLREIFGENRANLHFKEEHALYFVRHYKASKECVMDLFHLTEEEYTAVMMVLRRNERGFAHIRRARENPKVSPSVKTKIVNKYL